MSVVPFVRHEDPTRLQSPNYPMVGRNLFSVPLESKDNRALRLAESSHFLEMCEPILWGTESRQEFGEMLRGLVINFLPETYWDLEMLKTVAWCQWQINRAVRVQRSVYTNGTPDPDQSGLPKRTRDAYGVAKELDFLQNSLNQAIRNYLHSRKSKRQVS